MNNRIEIRQMSLMMCPDCRGTFRKANNCASCGTTKPPVTYWMDDSGDMLFDLISDVRESSQDTGD